MQVIVENTVAPFYLDMVYFRN